MLNSASFLLALTMPTISKGSYPIFNAHTLTPKIHLCIIIVGVTPWMRPLEKEKLR